jgi:ABC-type spermidine/putrescine transport system permease subunit II
VVSRLTSAGIIGGFLLVLLVLSGSMVPLDVAQLRTYGVVLLRWVNEHPSDLPVWRASWPLLVVAGVATVLLLRARAPESGGAPEEWQGRRSRGVWWWMAMAWGLSVVAPGVIYLINLRDPPHAATWTTIGRWVGWFWREWGPAARESGIEAAGVAALGLVIGGVMWWAGSGGRASRRAAVASAGVLLAIGLLPGILVGTSLRRTTDMAVPAVGDTIWIVVWAHLSRFAFVPALAGVWLARHEESALRDLRRLEGGESVRGFTHACLARRWGVLLGAAMVAGILSFHEIEATVAVWPPGIRNLAQEMLDALHFDRDQHLAAAAVNLMGAGVVVSYLAAWLLGSGRRRERRGGRGA